MLYPLLRPLLFCLDAERAHRLAIAALKRLPAGMAERSLPIALAGLDFPNPVGLAAGFDKDGQVFGQALGLGFGFAEVGTLTPRPQAGNPKPRLFRLAEDRAVINRLGFNNGGQEAALARLRRPRTGIVGVNVGANKESLGSDAALRDYAAGVAALGPHADYLTINISSPNTPGLRALQSRQALGELLAAVAEERGAGPPLFVKVAPDLEPAEIDDIVAVAIERRVDALIVGNTTLSRPPLRSAHAGETGGLSGAPLQALALQRLRDFRAASAGAIPLIAAGGIASGADAWERIRAGASLVQLYTAMVFEGPRLPRRIVRELTELLSRDGYGSVAEAVGSG